ncbi:MAG: GAF domain-containing sensor histidine kinase [Holophagales bacterium]|jgi:signal transduction histidine kinase|nr:GAF domain-containing sensor histidine kinase [Holophagales bacterium]MBK9966738.1 GAF domain-containing sensor histidine kinase [Holophagales bacterium]
MSVRGVRERLARSGAVRGVSTVTLPDSLARFNRAMTELTSRRLLGGGPLPPRVQGFTEVIGRALEVARVSLWLRDADRATLVCVDLHDARSGRHEAGEVVTEKEFPTYFAALEEERDIVAADAFADPRTNEFGPTYLVPHGIRSMLDVPLRRDGRTIGVLCVEDTVSRRDWTVEEELFAIAAANLLNLALETEERRRAEGALAAARDRAEAGSRAKTRFLRAMSHELRTPLNAILGYADLLVEEIAAGAEAGRREDVERIRTAGLRLLVLVEEALTLADLDAGRLTVRAEPVDAAQVVAEAVEAARPLLSGRPVRLEAELSSADSTLADRVHLGQVLASLLDNASKFTREGSIRVGMRGVEHQGRSWTEISVSDTGSGLTLELQGQLFTPFSPGDDDASRPFAGRGVGLAMARRLCMLMGGDIRVTSQPGAGATFTVRLPASADPGGAAGRT